MFELFVLFCLLYCTGIEGAVVRPTAAEGYGYEPRLLGWMKVHPSLESWRSARLTCHLEGAFLAAPWTVEFVSAISKLQREHIQPMAVVYSGAHETIPEGAYSNVQGSSLISLEPEDLEAYEHCGVIYSNGTTGEVDCKQRLPFVCFVPGSRQADDGSESTTPLPGPGDVSHEETTTFAPSTASSNLNEPTNTLVPAAACGDSSSGYKYSDKTRSCYLLHLVPVSWSDARRACRAEGGDLAVVNSAAEAQLLADLIISEAPDWLYVAVGFSFDYGSGNWMTVSGQPLEDAGYNKWERNQPNDDLSFYGCGYLSRGALFGNSADPYTRPFICEKSPEPVTNDNSIEWVLKPLALVSGDNSYDWTTVTTLAPPSQTPPIISEGSDEETLSLMPAPACGYEYFGYKYSNKTGHCYSLHSMPMPWSSARYTCRAEGGDLAVVNSAAEAQILANLIRAELPDWRFVAIGLSYDVQSGVWKTVDGQSIEESGYDKWGVDQPNDDLRFYNRGYLSKDAVFVNTADPYVRPFICEKTVELKPLEEDTEESSYERTTTAMPQTTSKTTTSDCGDYKYSTETGRCYSLHLRPVSWSDARRICHAEGGDLAVVNSVAEARFLANLISSNASDWIYAAIGFSFDSQSGVWKTVSGQPLEDAGYDKWENNQPNDDLDFYNCGYLSRHALFGNSACSYTRPLICEKSPVANAETNSEAQTKSEDNSFEWTMLAPPSTMSSMSEDIDESALALVPVPACGGGYKYSYETEHCYSLRSMSLPWSNARRTCRAEGGDLAVVNSAAEARILANLIWTAVPDWSYVAVGFSFDTLSGVWKTVDGQSIKEAGYDTWGVDQPNDDLRYFSSGYLSRNAVFVNTDGINYRPFICEMTPHTYNTEASLEWTRGSLRPYAAVWDHSSMPPARTATITEEYDGSSTSEII